MRWEDSIVHARYRHTDHELGNHFLFPKLEDGSRDLDHSTNHIETWKGLEKLYKAHPEKVKAIGVANYSVKYLEKLLPQASVVPAANQIENHPLLPQQEIVDFCNEKGIHVTAYSPFGSTGSPLFKDEAINDIAKKHSVTPGTVLLSYHCTFPHLKPTLSHHLPLQKRY
jgi:glycerol 2-dehydrogenase (NADP+)